MAPRDAAIGAFLDAVAATGPAPGAGSGGAVALALGIACGRKAVAMTLKHAPDAAGFDALLAHLSGLTDQALAGADADAACFTAYIDALRAKDAAARDQALADLVAVGENLVAIGDEARRKLLEAKSAIHPTMINDIAAALALIAAARTIHAACTVESYHALGHGAA